MLFYIISLFLENTKNKTNIVYLTNSNTVNKSGKNNVTIDKINYTPPILELCPISSYKQCSNNYNIYNKIESITQFNKPKLYNRINMWNSV